MTQQKDLKRRIRDRMAKTGESYTAARAHVVAAAPAQAPPPFPVVEPHDVTEEAVALGLKCKVYALDGFDARRALRQLHDALVTTTDLELEVMRTAVLWGRRPPPKRWSMEEVRAFLARARAGIGGVGPNGWLVAYVCDGVLLLAALSLMRDGTPTVFLRRVDATATDELALGGMMLR